MRRTQDFVLAMIAPLAATAVVLAAPACARKNGGAGFQMPPTPVEVAVAARRTVEDRLEALGTIQAGDAVTVVAEVNASVVSLPFREGGSIRRGELIAQLDDVQPRAEVARAEAIRDQRRAANDRVRSVIQQGAGTAQDGDDAKAALDVAEADLALAEARLAKSRVLAPFDGVVGARRVSPGAYLRAGDAITGLAQIDNLRVTFDAPERHLGKLRRGAQVTISTTADPDLALTGTVDFVDPVLDPVTRTASVVALVGNSDRRLLPGMSANVAAILAERSGAVTIPNEAVFVEGERSYVYVVKPDSTVARSALVLGTRLADVVEVVGGLEAGTPVVRAGHQKLYDGAKVFPVTTPPASAGDAPAAPTAGAR
jgi:membrane fusion protein (multidrug efflux system)